MSAIGVNVSTKDNSYTPWTALYKASRKRTKLEQDYQDAKEEAERLWHEYNSEVDYGEARLESLADDLAEYERYKVAYLNNLTDLENQAVIAERTQHRLWDYLNCAHELDDYPTREPDNVIMICRKCGLRE